jgi:hypothetical protein
MKIMYEYNIGISRTQTGLGAIGSQPDLTLFCLQFVHRRPTVTLPDVMLIFYVP